jgi:hypothetical protein
LVRRLGDRLAREGYRGFFEVDAPVDTDTEVPLFLFHILEFMDVDFDLDIDEINERWEDLASEDVWSQMILKGTDDIVQRLTATPSTGQYLLDGSGTLVFRRAAPDRHQLQNESSGTSALTIRARHLIDSVRTGFSSARVGVTDLRRRN